MLQEIHSTQWKARQRNVGIAVLILMTLLGCTVPGSVVPKAPLPPTGDTLSTTAAPQKILLTPIVPKVFTAAVNGVHLGDPNARVKIDVWEDFQCPACKSYSENIEPDVIKNLVETGKVYYTFHFFPFLEQFGNPPTHESHQAASAAMCASSQGRFWDFHDMLFTNWTGENEGGFSDARLMAMAEALGLDMPTFTACFQSDQFRAEIDQDMSAGQTIGVQGTPSVFVNGTIVTPGYVPGYDDISKAVEAALSGQ